MVPFLLWKSAYRKFSTGADIFSIIVTDITILFSDLVSLIVPLQTWNVKYYKYAIIKNGLKSLVKALYNTHTKTGENDLHELRVNDYEGIIFV